MHDKFTRVVIYALTAALVVTMLFAKHYANGMNKLTAADTNRVLSAAGWSQGEVVKDAVERGQIPLEAKSATGILTVEGETGWVKVQPEDLSRNLSPEKSISDDDYTRVKDVDYDGEPVEIADLPPVGPGSAMQPVTPGSPSPCAISQYNLGLKDLFIIKAHGVPYIKGRLWADIRLADGGEQHLEGELLPTRFEVSRWVVTERKRVTFGLRSPKHWRMGWSGGCGIGVTITGRSEPLCAVLWGVQF